jgi:murein DD-endopeptidase MepM/ murein hydrolase activator NlpD
LHNSQTSGGWGRRLANWFPDREFFMRSQGQVRFIKITSRVQIFAAAIAATALLAWAISMAVMAWSQYAAGAERASLLEREAKVASAEERFNDYSNDLGNVVEDLNDRQKLLEMSTEMLPEDIRANETVSDSSTEAAETADKVSALFPEARELAQIEARQLALAERLTRFADRRSAQAADALRKLGLDPNAMVRGADRSAMDGELDPRVERLGLSLARMAALERTLDGIPQVLPASRASISSGFGYRRDPFNGHAAMHSGLDFKGPIGAPIYAAADGRVSFVGRKSGYGNVVEISHGNGLMTRYAHMSRFNARVGQAVEAGHIIGAIGNTGRSTGPHLHFEVRVNDRAVNPRPFLEKAPNVLKEARTAGSRKQAGA